MEEALALDTPVQEKKVNKELKSLKRRIFGRKKIKIEFLDSPFFYLRYLVVMGLGFSSAGITPNRFDKELTQYIIQLRKIGYPSSTIDKMVRKCSNSYRFGFETSRICRRVKF